MIKINIHEAKTHLSSLLSKLKKGEKIIICKRNVPVAEIVPITPLELRGSRPIGLAKGQFAVPELFFEPIPDDILQAFYGVES